jgi:hypothetical protein
MKLIADLLRRVWLRNQSASDTEIPVMADNSMDRSSMADFVRILEAENQDGTAQELGVDRFP